MELKRPLLQWRHLSTEAALFVLCAVSGHTWPGGTQHRLKDQIGPICRDYSASEVMGEFFKGQAKR